MKKTSTKRALISALLALVMTVSMLVGSTFAWFTDSVTSSGNKITAGNLNVELYLYDGDSYENISNATQPIFGENGLAAAADGSSTIWEPGKTQVAYLAIKNEGSLALKYKVALNVTNIQGSINDVLSYTITPNAKGEAPLTAWDETNALGVVAGEQIVSGTAEDAYVAMEPGTIHYFALSIHMDEDAGNDYMLSSITFDINIIATQVESETDSFGFKYDMGLDVDRFDTYSGMYQELSDGTVAFYYDDYSNIELVSLPENVGTEYVVPYQINDLGAALVNNTEIEKLVVHSGVKSAYKALQGSAVKEVVLEDGIKSIPSGMFYMTDIASIDIPDSVTSIGSGAFQQNHAITSIEIPASVTSIGAKAFYECTSLASVNVPEGVTSIGEMAFRNTAITSITLPASVTEIGKNAFRDCDKLTAVYIKAESFTIVSNAFDNVAAPYPTTTIYVQNEAMKTYLEGVFAGNSSARYITVDIAPVEVSDEASLTAALASGAKKILLTNNIGCTAGIVVPAGVTLNGGGNSITYAGAAGSHNLIMPASGAVIENITLNNYRIKTPSTADSVITVKDTTINFSVGNQVCIDASSSGSGKLILDGVICNGATDAAHLDPATQSQADYSPYGDILIGGTWALDATDSEFGSIHGWNSRNGSSISLTNVTYSVFRMHYIPARTLYINGVETAWSDSDAVPVAHDVGGCWSVQPAFR